MTFSFQPLLEQLIADNSVLVLTANQRLATHILQQYDSWQQQQKQTVWKTPAVFTLGHWLRECYLTLLTQGKTAQLLLTDKQTLFLWQQILASYNEERDIPLQAYQTAQACLDAWRTLKQWQMPITQQEFSSNKDCETFFELAQQFKKICKKNQWLDTDSAQQCLVTYFENHSLAFPTKIILAGFIELTPLQEKWLSLAKTAGTTIQYWKNPYQAQTTAMACESTQDELEKMAAWAAQQINQGETGIILCVHPKLSDLRSKAEYQFSKILHTQINPNIPYNISGGSPLVSYLLIQTALQLLHLDPLKISTIEFGEWIQSPYLIHSHSEKYLRAKLDVFLRRKGHHEFALQHLLTYLEKSEKNSSLLSALSAYLVLFQNKPHQATLAFWAHFFTELLQTLGWPGQRGIETLEYQLLTRWQETLIEFASLEMIYPTITYVEAVQHLHYLAKTSMFQEETSHAQVQLLGLLEAVGFPCEKVWIGGLDDQNWPATAKPNPFIPYALQRSQQMPHANAEKELQFSQKIMALFSESTPHLVLSYACQEKDAQLDPSPLIAPFINQQPVQFAVMTESFQPGAPLEIIADDQAPPLAALSHIQGGTTILKNQSLCPFKAFASQRLHAAPIESPQAGYKKYEQGNHLHHALEKIWGQLHNWETLNGLSEDELTRCVTDIVVQVIYDSKEVAFKKTNAAYKSLEKEFLVALILKWLNFEKNRPYPFEVFSRESGKNILLSELEFSIKIDRIDKIDDAHYLIIDYKSGDAISAEDCLGERPDEPQLPLYAITADQPISGIFFGKIHAKEQKMIGHSCLDNIVSNQARQKVMTDQEWSTQLTTWKNILEKLAREIREGIANVSPKKRPHEAGSPCEHCQLHSLCRIYEDLDHV